MINTRCWRDRQFVSWLTSLCERLARELSSISDDSHHIWRLLTQRFFWWFRIYFHQMNYLQLPDKRLPHLRRLLASHRARKKMNEWMNSRLPPRKNVYLMFTFFMFIPSVENWRMYHALSPRTDINFFSQQWKRFLCSFASLMMDIIKSNRERKEH